MSQLRECLLRTLGFFLKKIIKGRSVIVIEHDMKFVEDIADRVTVMHQGKLLAEGNMESIKKNPKVIDVYLGQ